MSHARAALLTALFPLVGGLAVPPSWSELGRRLPSAAAARPPVYDAATVAAADLEGETVLYRDRNGWSPQAERAWLALEVKRAAYVTVLVDDDYTDAGSLPRVVWRDGTASTSICDILERIEAEHPRAPRFFPRASVTVDVARDSFVRFDGVMPRFTRPSHLAPFVFVEQIQREGRFELEEARPGEIVPSYKYQVCLEEIDEILGEYEDGPFIAGADLSAADVFWVRGTWPRAADRRAARRARRPAGPHRG